MRSSRPDGLELDIESGGDDRASDLETPAREHPAHAPARRASVREEARSVVIAAEVDDDKTPPRAVRPMFGSSPDLEIHQEEDLLSDPLPRFDELTPSDPLPKKLAIARRLPTYDHRHDPTIVLARRSPRPAFALPVQLAPHQLYVVVAAAIVTACAAAFIIGAAIVSLFQSVPAPVAQPSPSVESPPVRAAQSIDSVDVPVTLTDLPIVQE